MAAGKAAIKDALDHGLFSDPAYISLGDPYEKKEPRKPRRQSSSGEDEDSQTTLPIVVPTRPGRLFDERPPRAFKVRPVTLLPGGRASAG